MNLYDIRWDANLKQIDVANILQVKRSTYSLWEREISPIPLKRLIMFCDYFNVSIDYALGLTRKTRYSNSKPGLNQEIYLKRIKWLRVLNKYSQEYLASLLGTDNSVISRYEKGEKLIITNFLIAYSKIFNVSCDYLLGCTDNPEIVDTLIRV